MLCSCDARVWLFDRMRVKISWRSFHDYYLDDVAAAMEERSARSNDFASWDGVLDGEIAR